MGEDCEDCAIPEGRNTSNAAGEEGDFEQVTSARNGKQKERKEAKEKLSSGRIVGRGKKGKRR